MHEIIERYNNGERDFSKAVLGGADLSWANLISADLSGADLSRANLRWANLRAANLSEANLDGADLRWADLSGADLSGANLGVADLSGADLSRANLRGAFLPSPTTVLLANWGEVSYYLCRDLMRFDADCHDSPQMFEKWAFINGPCPYTGKRFQRACNFQEDKSLYSPGKPPKIFNLMVRLIREKCADSDWHKK